MIICLWTLGCLGLFGREHTRTTGKYYEELANRTSLKLRGVFQGDYLSSFLFITALIPLSLNLRLPTLGYEFVDKTKINHLFFLNDLKLSGKEET